MFFLIWLRKYCIFIIEEVAHKELKKEIFTVRILNIVALPGIIGVLAYEMKFLYMSAVQKKDDRKYRKEGVR
jgi:hypothetical protein